MERQREALEKIKCDVRHDSTCPHLEDPKNLCKCVGDYLYITAKAALSPQEPKGPVCNHPFTTNGICPDCVY